MKTKKLVAGMAIFGMLIAPAMALAQQPQIVVITTFHRKMGMENTFDEWKKTEKEYFDKVVRKNEYVQRANVLVHFFTADASEVLFIQFYKNWEDIEKAAARDDELSRVAWPDSVKRAAFFKKQNSFYDGRHSDEIMTVLPFEKMLAPGDTTQYVYHFRTSHRAFPEDGSNADFRKSMQEIMDNIIMKDHLLKRYAIARHQWGADSRVFLEVAAYNSLSDMEKAFALEDELAKQHWPDEKKRKEFFAHFDRYFEPWHADALYRNVPGLRK